MQQSQTESKFIGEKKLGSKDLGSVETEVG
jgi:hypothetical protein